MANQPVSEGSLVSGEQGDEHVEEGSTFSTSTKTSSSLDKLEKQRVRRLSKRSKGTSRAKLRMYCFVEDVGLNIIRRVNLCDAVTGIIASSCTIQIIGISFTAENPVQSKSTSKGCGVPVKSYTK